jgi:signal transduction histidine kinase
VQQACENASRHANAQLVQISGILAPEYVEMTVEDDGDGFVLAEPLDIANLLAHKHFGLVHMMERAEHIQAQLTLDSALGRGTRVRVVWRDDGRQRQAYPP